MNTDIGLYWCLRELGNAFEAALGSHGTEVVDGWFPNRDGDQQLCVGMNLGFLGMPATDENMVETRERYIRPAAEALAHAVVRNGLTKLYEIPIGAEVEGRVEVDRITYKPDKDSNRGYSLRAVVKGSAEPEWNVQAWGRA